MPLTTKGKQKLAKKLQAKLRDAAARISAFAVDAVLEYTPREIPGRMQAAWLNALQKLDIFDTDVKQYTQPVITKRQPEAADEFDHSWKHGFADVYDSPLKITVKLLNVLSFASTVEHGSTVGHGGPIEVGVGGNTGPKLSKSFPGQLDSPRLPTGRGMLRWIDESGQQHMQIEPRDMPGSHSIAKAKTAIRQYAKKLGFN